MSQADKRRRRRRAAAKRAANDTTTSDDTTTSTMTTEPTVRERSTRSFGTLPPGVSGNVDQVWQPGQAGNPRGYSKHRRIADALHRALDRPGLEDDVAKTVVAMALGQKLGDRKPDLLWFKELRNMVDGPISHVIVTADVEPAAAATIVNVVATATAAVEKSIDAATAERIMAAADPTTTIEDDGPTTETTT